MAIVSDALKQAFNPNNGEGGRQIDYTVRFEIIDEDALNDALPSAIEDAEISRLYQVTGDIDSTPLNVATFELNGFPLDGTVYVPPRVNESQNSVIGLIMPDVSSDNGLFANEQVFSVIMSAPHNILSLAINWGRFVPADFDVVWRQGTTIIYTYNVRNNAESNNVINHAEKEVDSISFVIYRSAEPHRHVRVAGFTLGAILQYTRDNTESITLREVIDPLSERAPKNTLSVVVDNFARDFDIYNPDGIYAYFRERMRLYPRVGAMIDTGAYEYINMGIYYLQAPKLRGNLSIIELDAVDALGTVSESMYTTGRYNSDMSLSDAMNAVQAAAPIGIQWPDDFGSIYFNGYIPSMTVAQAYQKIAQATNTVVRTSRDETYPVKIEAITMTDRHLLGRDDYRMESGITPEDDDPINTVIVEYSEITVADERSVLVEMSYPGTLIWMDFYADNAVLHGTAGDVSAQYSPSTEHHWTLTTSGQVQITGRTLNSVVGSVSRTTRVTSDPEYAYTVSGNPFITTPEVAASVADYLLKRRGIKRRTTTANYRGYPYIETGDTARFAYGDNDIETQDHFVTENTLTLIGGGMSGVLKAREL